MSLTFVSLLSRSLRGNVDRNIPEKHGLAVAYVVPYVGTWIEILSIGRRIHFETVVPYVGTWIEMQYVWT